MTGWLIVLALAGASALLLFRLAPMPRAAKELAGAALLLGLAGYAWQGSPGLAGRPTQAKDAGMQPDSAFAEARRGLDMGRFGQTGQWLDYADALHRMGQDRLAVTAVRSGLRQRPDDADLWVGLGNALVLHGGGLVSPAAKLAFARAAALAPDHPGPPYFLALAYAQGGQLDLAAETWRALLARAPAGAPWRAQVEQRLAEVEANGG